MIRIRKASNLDAPVLQAIKESLLAKAVKERLKRQDRGEVDFLVLEEDRKIISFVLLKWQGKPTHPEYPDIEDLYTKESKRRLGYGSRLLERCEELAKQRGFAKIGLAVNPTFNKTAREFYEKRGYKHDHRATYLDGTYAGTKDWVIDLEKGLLP